MLWFRILSFIDCNNICRCYHLLCGYALLVHLIWKILVRVEWVRIERVRESLQYTKKQPCVHHANTWTSLIRNLNTLFFLFFYELRDDIHYDDNKKKWFDIQNEKVLPKLLLPVFVVHVISSIFYSIIFMFYVLYFIIFCNNTRPLIRPTKNWER